MKSSAGTEKKVKESLLTLEEVLSATKGEKILGPDRVFFTSVVTDSRQVKKDSLFVPLIGEKLDGHTFIGKALDKGASLVFVAKSSWKADKDNFISLSEDYPDAVFIALENTMTGLQKTAGKYVSKFPKLIKVAVTGSSGKTTTKEIAAAILSSRYSVITNEGNLNSETGLPLSVFNIRSEHEIGIFEMGMNRENEIGEIAEVLKPSYAIITNIGTAHIGKLGSRDNIAKEKAKVFDFFNGKGTGFIPEDDDYKKYLASCVHGKVVYYGENAKESTVRFVKDRGLEGTEFSIAGQHGLIPLPGKYNYRNALGAIALAQNLGLSASEVIAGVKKIKPLFGRSEVLKGNWTIIQDCYNANPDSMEKALDLLSELDFEGKKGCVLGDMLELGSDSKKAHKKTGKMAAGLGFNLIIFLGSEMENAYNEAKKIKSKTKIFYIEGHEDADIEKAAKSVKKYLPEGNLLLIKGSRGMGLERLTKILEGGNK